MRLRPPIVPTRSSTVAVFLLLAACGGGGGGGGVASLDDGERAAGDTTDTTLSEEEAEEAMLDWVDCMRDQGLDIQVPELDGDGGGGVVIRGQIGGGGASGGDDGAPTGPPDRQGFEDAREACGEPPRIGGAFTEEDREEMEENALAFAECMRDEGIEDFPDPDFSEFGPGTGPAARAESRADDDGGGTGPRAVVRGPFGEIELDDPEVRAAFESCQGEMGGGPALRLAPGGAAAVERAG